MDGPPPVPGYRRDEYGAGFERYPIADDRMVVRDRAQNLTTVKGDHPAPNIFSYAKSG